MRQRPGISSRKILYSLLRGPCSRFSEISILFLALILTCSLGCGYHFLGKGKGTLGGIKTIAIPYFINKTYEPGIDRIFTDALVNEFVESREFVLTTEDRADVVMRGMVKSFEGKTISHNQKDRALEYRVAVTLEFSAEERTTGKVIWRDRNITHNEEYRVNTDIAVTEFNKDEAIKRLAAELAERIHDNLLEGF